jgi:membrane protein DedA with SNARE-associated domain
MLENVVEYLSALPWYWVLFAAFFFTILENVFPPSPSDSVLIFLGTLVGINVVGFIPLLLVSTLGSLVGFVMMFYLGVFVGHRVLKSTKFPFITYDSIKKPTIWLRKYGYYVIAINRFLSGTRGVISFIAGMAEMKHAPTISLAGVSALIWNAILIYLGIILGHNWRLANIYIEIYGKYIFIGIILILTSITIRYFYIQRKNKRNQDNLPKSQ